MKITMYELLKLIKENKDLPKKIKYGNGIYALQENPEDYATWLYDNLDLLNDVILGHFNIEDAIYFELEILEEEPRNIEVCGSWFTKSEYDKLAHSEEEKKIPEKLDIGKMLQTKKWKRDKKTWEIINSIIDYLNSNGE